MKYTLLFAVAYAINYLNRQRLHAKNRAKVRQKNDLNKFFTKKTRFSPL